MTTEENIKPEPKAPAKTGETKTRRSLRRPILFGSALLLIALVMLFAGIVLGRTSKKPAAQVKSPTVSVPKKKPVRKHHVNRCCCICKKGNK